MRSWERVFESGAFVICTVCYTVIIVLVQIPAATLHDESIPKKKKKNEYRFLGYIWQHCTRKTTKDQETLILISLKKEKKKYGVRPVECQMYAKVVDVSSTTSTKGEKSVNIQMLYKHCTQFRISFLNCISFVVSNVLCRST